MTSTSKHQPLFKLLSVILALCLLCTGGSLTALADVAKPDYSNLIVEELEEYRTEYSKTYLRNDGSLEAVVSAAPLHFKELGSWVEYDNTLELNENKGTYTNKKAPFSVSLPESTKNGKEVVISKDGYTISMKLIGAKNTNANKSKTKEKATKAQRKTMSAQQIMSEDIVSVDKVKYDAVLDDTNIEYEVDSKSVKENIILNKEPKKAVSYTYQITAEGMQIEKRTNGSIWFYPEDDQEKLNPIFYIPIPFMYDSNDEYSYDIETDLEIKNKKATLTYTPSLEWLTDSARAYPVTIDPTVTMHSGIHDGYTYSYAPYGDNIYGFEDQLKVGKSAWKSDCDYFETYIKFDNLPEYPDKYWLVDASIVLTPKKSCGNWEEFIVGAYEITEDWQNVYTASGETSLTYNNRPDTSADTTSTTKFNFDCVGESSYIDVTMLTKAWYSGEKDNNGVKLSMVNETNNAWDSMIFHSSRNAAYAPYLSVIFEYNPNYDNYLEITNKPENDKIHLTDVGQTYTFDYEIILPEISNKEIVWSTSDSNIATFEDQTSGVLTIKNVGLIEIVASAKDNIYIREEYDLEIVFLPATGIEIINKPENNTVTLTNETTTFTLDTVLSPENASGGYVIYTSSNENVATIDNWMGTVTPLYPGTTTITATWYSSADSISVSDSFELIVEGPPIERIEIQASSIEHIIGTDPYYPMQIAIYPESSSNFYLNHITVLSSDNSVASVINASSELSYYIYVNNEGTATITAFIDGFPNISDSIEVTVIEPQAESIDVRLHDHNINGTYHRTAYLYITPEEYASILFDDVTLSSSNPDVIEIIEKDYTNLGYTVAVKSVGTTTFTATVGDYTISKEIEIYPAPYIPITAATIYNPPANDTLFAGQTYQLLAEIFHENATNPEIVYESSEPSVASISSTGLITAYSPGTTVITVGNGVDDIEATLYLTVQSTDFTFNPPDTNIISVGQTWDFSDDSNVVINPQTDGIVQVNGDGSVTGLRAGVVVLEVYRGVNTGQFIRYILTVNQTVDISPNIPDVIYTNTKFTLYRPDGIDYEYDINYTTSDASIAYFRGNEDNSAFEFIALKSGTVNIVFRCPELNIYDQVTVTILGVPVTSVEIDYQNTAKTTMYVGQSQVIHALALPVDSSNRDIIWTVSNNCVKLVVSDIKTDTVTVMAMAGGTVTLTATAADGSGKYDTFVITVIEPKITITNAPTDQLLVGDTHQLGITKTDHAQFEGWSSSDNSIAYVNTNNQIVALNPGTVTISAHTRNTINDKVYISSAITVDVYQPVQSVAITNSPEDNKLKISDTFDFNAVITPANASNQSIIWSISNPAIASIDPTTGVIKATSVGEVTVTVTSADGKTDKCTITIIGNWAEILTNSDENANSNYDRELARTYMETYYEVYNDEYFNFNQIPDGGDCTNYISQCLYAGGLEMEGKPLTAAGDVFNFKDLDKWYANPDLFIDTPGRVAPGYSNTWSSAENFRLYWGKTEDENIGRAYQYIHYLTSDDFLKDFAYLRSILNVGDILQIRGHSMIISKITDSDILYSAHTYNALDKSFNANVLQNGTIDIYVTIIKKGE